MSDLDKYYFGLEPPFFKPPQGNNLVKKVLQDGKRNKLEHFAEEKKDLTNLCLTGGKITNQNFRYLQKILDNNPCLKVVDLSGNSLDDADVKLLAESLENKTQLYFLDLKKNKITMDGAKHLCEMIKEKKIDEKNIGERELLVFLGNNMFGEADLKQLKENYPFVKN